MQTNLYILTEPFGGDTGWIVFLKSVPLTDPSRFDFFPSPGPLPHRIRLRANQQPPLTSILLILTCEPVTPGNLKGEVYICDVKNMVEN